MASSILTLLSKLHKATGRPPSQFIHFLVRIVRSLLSNRHVAELWRFILLGTVVETSKIVGQKVVDLFSGFFVIRATFTSSEFAYDWVRHYLDAHHVWDESRSFKVVSRNTSIVSPKKHGDLTGKPKSELGLVDGHPDPVYEPAPQAPELFKWRGYWISINKDDGYSSHSGNEVGGTLNLTLWSRNRKVLDEFVLAARDFYANSPVPPVPRRVETGEDTSGSLLTATFTQGDWSHDWMLSYLLSETALRDITDFSITTKQSDIGWASSNSADSANDETSPNPNAFPQSDLVRYLPSSDSKQMFLYTSKTGRKVWMQVTMIKGHEDYRGNTSGGSIKIVVHSSHKPILAEIIESARQQYMSNASSRVVLHLTDTYGSWGKTMTKSRRMLHTVVLPDSVKENLLQDLQEFTASESWYVSAGVPHRRGYLLYGQPGTGKSSTIHAMAGELGLEIYVISLASPGMDDHTLLKLISDTPSRCIILLEDIDCAFPSRSEDEDEEEDRFDANGNLIPPGMVPAKSSVTLSGLLNMLDSVSSEEGRITFATTNHIENLDPALIRPGRMDVKIQYKLATAAQAAQVFVRFYPPEVYTKSSSLQLGATSHTTPQLTPSELSNLARDFSASLPTDRFSVAQLQGYLLTKKFDPKGAVQGVKAWVDELEEERRLAEEKRRKRIEKRRAAAASNSGQVLDKELAALLKSLEKESTEESTEESKEDSKEETKESETESWSDAQPGHV